MVDQNKNKHLDYQRLGPVFEDVDIRGLLLMIWRRKMSVLAVVLVGLSISIFLVSVVSERYTARSLILIKSDSQQLNISEDSLLAKASVFDVSFILTELEVLKSRNLAANVVRKLDLMKDPEFSGSRDKDVAVVGFDNKKRSNFRNLSVDGTELKTLSPEALDKNVADAVTRFLDALRVNAIPGSKAVQVSFISSNPYKASKIVNTLVEEYIAHKLSQKYEAQRRLTDWLDDRLKKLRRHVFEAETEIEEHKNLNNLAQGKRHEISAEQLSQLNQRLVQAQTQYAEVKAKLKQSSGKHENDASVDVKSNTVDAAVIKSLTIEVGRLQSGISELSSRYGPKHPVMIKKHSELEEVRRSLALEQQKSKQTLKRELSIAQARVDEIRKNMDEVKMQSHEDSGALIKLRELEREAESSRLVLRTFLETYKRTAGKEALQDADIEVISYAAVPYEPSYPNKKLILSLGAFVSLFFGLALAVFVEKLDNAFRSVEHLEKALAIRCHGLVPSPKGIKKEKLAGYVLSNPSSAVSEAIRNLSIALNEDRNENSKKANVLTVTSSTEKEGKTVLSAWLGRLNARSGKRVILVDVNLRQPSLAKILNVSNKMTLVDYLTGQETLENITLKDTGTSMDIILAQPIPNSAFDLLNSAKFSLLLDELREKYDFVILDAPPSIDLPDAKLVSQKSDGTLYVVTAGQTPRDSVTRGVRYFKEQTDRDFSAVLTDLKA